jgi:hypothetical protein
VGRRYTDTWSIHRQHRRSPAGKMMRSSNHCQLSKNFNIYISVFDWFSSLIGIFSWSLTTSLAASSIEW